MAPKSYLRYMKFNIGRAHNLRGLYANLENYNPKP
jgi:hypothetical protein